MMNSQNFKASNERIQMQQKLRFFAIFIYMGVHDSHRTDYYWRNDSNQGSVHMPQFYINQTHFERLKRYLHISDPRERNSLRQLPKSVEELNKKNGDIRLNHWPS